VETASEEASTAHTSAPSEPAAFASGCVPSLRSRRVRRGTRREAHSPGPRRRGVDGEDAAPVASSSSGKRANASDDHDDDAEETRACPSDAAPLSRTPRSDEEPKPNDEESTETTPRRREHGGGGDARDEPSNRANLPGWVASPVARLSERVVSREDRRDEYDEEENGENKSLAVKHPTSSLRDARSRSPSSLLARLATLSANVDSRFEGLDSRVTRGHKGQRERAQELGENVLRRQTTPSTETSPGPLHALVKSVVARQRAGYDDAETDDDEKRRRAKDAESNKENDDDALRRAMTSFGDDQLVSFVSSPKTPKTRFLFRTKTPSAFSAARAIPRFERVASRSESLSLNDRQTGGGFVVTKALLEDENAKRLALGSLFDSEELALCVKENDARSDGRRNKETEEEETRVFAALEALVTRADI
jgi:hypothetical protein